jgi:zinc transporter 9
VLTWPLYTGRGIEALARSRPSNALDGASIALPLLFGFTFMLVIEQLSSSHANQRHPTHRAEDQHASVASRDDVFDVELAGFEVDEDVVPAPPPPRRASVSAGVAKTNREGNVPPSAYPITIGLVVHGLADGLALGMSMLSTGDSSRSYGLSLVVFLALAVHKGTFYQESHWRLSSLRPTHLPVAAPTAFAYTLSLMSTSLTRAGCKKHLILFSASTPLGAIASYASLSFFGSRREDDIGIALLISVSFSLVNALQRDTSMNM